MYGDEPALWAMDAILETLDNCLNRLAGTKDAKWCHPVNFSEAYPARLEPNWCNVATGLPEEEHDSILIEIPPRGPQEFKAFDTRFNETCRKVRAEYVRKLKDAARQTRLPYRDFTWIDRLARWQAGYSAAEIDPTVTTPSKRVMFSKSLSRTAKYLHITRRTSKNDPRHKRSRH